MRIELRMPFGLAAAGQILDVAAPVADEMIRSHRAVRVDAAVPPASARAVAPQAQTAGKTAAKAETVASAASKAASAPKAKPAGKRKAR